MLHTFHDGSVLKLMKATELVKIPVWQGNRILDKEHANKLRNDIGSEVECLDSGYRIVNYEEEDATGRPIRQMYLIDGQHRQYVLKEHFLGNLCEPDFDVVVQEKNVSDQSEALAYFRAINNAKPLPWKVDPKLLVNDYIEEFEKRFNTKADKLIRSKKTRRPYLHVEDLREALLKLANTSRLEQEPIRIRTYVQRVFEWNSAEVNQGGLRGLFGNKDKTEPEWWSTAIKLKFMLAVDPKLKWVEELLG